MYSVYAYDKQKYSRDQGERDLLKSSQIQEKIRLHREKLCENYTKRISDFIMHMEKQPIKISTHQPPLEVAPRPSDPTKFKGKPQIIIREYKTHRERLLVFFI